MKLPPYIHFPKLVGEKVTLREIKPEDLHDLIEISFYDAIQATTVQQAAEMNNKIAQDYQNGNSIHWGIVDNLTNKIVGTCGYYRGLEKEEGELGCVLLPQHQGKGYMTVAMTLAINFGLSIGLKRIWAMTSNENKKAKELLERLHFIKEKELMENDAVYELDHYLFSIRKNTLSQKRDLRVKK